MLKELDVNLTIMKPNGEDFDIDLYLALQNIRDNYVDIEALKKEIKTALVNILTKYGDVEERE
jgi:hypothetical protein